MIDAKGLQKIGGSIQSQTLTIAQQAGEWVKYDVARA